MGAAADLGVSDRLAKLENGRGEAGGAWVGGAERRGSRTGILARSCYLPNRARTPDGPAREAQQRAKSRHHDVWSRSGELIGARVSGASPASPLPSASQLTPAPHLWCIDAERDETGRHIWHGSGCLACTINVANRAVRGHTEVDCRRGVRGASL